MKRLLFPIMFFAMTCTNPVLMPADQDTILRVVKYVHNTIEYKDDVLDQWQRPAVTLRKGTGDCEDFVVLAMYILWNEYGIDSSLVIVNYNGTGVHHAVMLIEGVYYEVTGGRKSAPWEITEVYRIYSRRFIMAVVFIKGGEHDDTE